jgi:hypothetical protein
MKGRKLDPIYGGKDEENAHRAKPYSTPID